METHAIVEVRGDEAKTFGITDLLYKAKNAQKSLFTHIYTHMHIKHTDILNMVSSVQSPLNL